MQTRRFGRTNHFSTVAIFGAAGLWTASQAEADAMMAQVLAAGVNHIDVAPSYGVAEERLGPWMPRLRDRFFLGCKTMERTAAGAAAELRGSLERLQVDAFDLYQIHAVTTMDELDAATRPGGALDALVAARDVGTMIIKSVSRGPWGNRPKTHQTWYQPFADLDHIQQAVDFALSQQVTGLCTAGDPQPLRLMLQACEAFTPMSQTDQEELIATAGQYEPLFV